MFIFDQIIPLVAKSAVLSSNYTDMDAKSTIFADENTTCIFFL